LASWGLMTCANTSRDADTVFASMQENILHF
jgi:hypothetical protein